MPFTSKLPGALTLLLMLPHSVSAQDSVSLFGQNLIVNGDAESGDSDPNGYNPITSIPGWSISGTPDVVQYASGYDIALNNPHPLAAGNSYFCGGRTADNSSLAQTIDLSSGAETIDTGTVTFIASAYLGGWESEPESAQMTVTFLDAAGNPLSSATLGPVSHTDREDGIGLWYRRIVGQVPAGARAATVVLQMNWVSGHTNDGAADNLSLVLNTPADPASLLGNNLIVNGNADTPAVADAMSIDGSVVDVPGWNRTGRFTLDSYTDNGADLDNNSAGPDDRGKFYFYGGSGNALSSAFQDIDISSAAPLLDSGNATYQLSAWLGGYASQDDNSVLTVDFRDWSGMSLGSVTLGPVTWKDRGGVSALLPFAQGGAVPSGTRVIRVTLTMTRTDGGDNDGLADSLSLVLSAPTQN